MLSEVTAMVLVRNAIRLLFSNDGTLMLNRSLLYVILFNEDLLTKHKRINGRTKSFIVTSFLFHSIGTVLSISDGGGGGCRSGIDIEMNISP